MTNSDASIIEETLSDSTPLEDSELSEHPGELLAELSDTDDMFYYENGHNSAIFISAGIHCLIFVLLIYTWKTTFFKGAAEEQTAQGGIVLVNNSSESPTYHQNPNEHALHEPTFSTRRRILLSRVLRHSRKTPFQVVKGDPTPSMYSAYHIPG